MDRKPIASDPIVSQARNYEISSVYHSESSTNYVQGYDVSSKYDSESPNNWIQLAAAAVGLATTVIGHKKAKKAQKSAIKAEQKAAEFQANEAEKQRQFEIQMASRAPVANPPSSPIAGIDPTLLVGGALLVGVVLLKGKK